MCCPSQFVCFKQYGTTFDEKVLERSNTKSGKFQAPSATHWVNLRLTIHARSSAIDTPSGAHTVHV